jgi:hypothetical protein
MLHALGVLLDGLLAIADALAITDAARWLWRRLNPKT